MRKVYGELAVIMSTCPPLTPLRPRQC